MTDIITTAACPHCGSGASWRRAMPTTGGRPVRLCTVCGRVSVDEDWTVPAVAEPVRVLPSRDEIAEAICRINDGESYVEDGGPCSACESAADAVLALFATQPTVAEVKAKAWHEGLHAGYAYISRCEDAEAAGQGFIVPDPVNPYRLAPTQPTPVFEAMDPTPEVPNVGGEDHG